MSDPMLRRLGKDALHDVSKPIATWLRHGSSFARPAGPGKVPISRYGWVDIAVIEDVFGMAHEEMLNIIYQDKKGRFNLHAVHAFGTDNQATQKFRYAWAVRATSGHSIPWLNYEALMAKNNPGAGNSASDHGSWDNMF